MVKLFEILLFAQMIGKEFSLSPALVLKPGNVGMAVEE
jgi:hypothetical protein